MKKMIFVLLGISSQVFSQRLDTTKVQERRVGYFFVINSGMMAGDQGKSINYTFSTVHGVTLGKRLRVGGGLGLDAYKNWQTMPLFGQISYDFIQTRNGSLFLQASYGWAHAWSQKEEYASVSSDHGGKVYSSMIGYRLSSGSLKVYATLGYKFQSVWKQYDYSYGIDYGYSYYAQRTEQNFERLVFTIGVGLN